MPQRHRRRLDLRRDVRATQPRLTRGVLLGTVAVLIVAAVCVRLGIWQLSRLNEKRARNDALIARSEQPSVRINAFSTDTAELIFRRADALGRYDDARSIVLPGRAFQGTPGVHLLTPLRLEGGPAVLVLRGFVPSADAATIDAAAFADTAAIHADGVLLPFPNETNSIAPRGAVAADSFRRVWYTIDAEALRAQFPYELLPFLLQLRPEVRTDRSPRSYPLRLPVPAPDEGPHLGYAVQWFSFAGIALIGWMVLLLRRPSGRAREDDA